MYALNGAPLSPTLTLAVTGLVVRIKLGGRADPLAEPCWPAPLPTPLPSPEPC